MIEKSLLGPSQSSALDTSTPITMPSNNDMSATTPASTTAPRKYQPIRKPSRVTVEQFLGREDNISPESRKAVEQIIGTEQEQAEWEMEIDSINEMLERRHTSYQQFLEEFDEVYQECCKKLDFCEEQISQLEKSPRYR